MMAYMIILKAQALPRYKKIPPRGYFLIYIETLSFQTPLR